MLFTISENNLHLVFELEENKPVLFLHMGANPQVYTPADNQKFLYTMQEIQATGESKLEHFGLGPSGTFPGNRMNYITHTDERNEFGRLLTIYTKDPVTGLAGKCCISSSIVSLLSAVRIFLQMRAVKPSA